MTSKVLSWSPNRIVLEQRLVKAPCFQSDQGHLGPTTESFAVKWLRGGVWFSPQFLEKDIDPAVMKCRRPQTVEGRLIFLEGFHRGFDTLDRGCQTLLWGGGDVSQGECLCLCLASHLPVCVARTAVSLPEDSARGQSVSGRNTSLFLNAHVQFSGVTCG